MIPGIGEVDPPKPPMRCRAMQDPGAGPVSRIGQLGIPGSRLRYHKFSVLTREPKLASTVKLAHPTDAAHPQRTRRHAEFGDPKPVTGGRKGTGQQVSSTRYSPGSSRRSLSRAWSREPASKPVSPWVTGNMCATLCGMPRTDARLTRPP